MGHHQASLRPERGDGAPGDGSLFCDVSWPPISLRMALAMMVMFGGQNYCQTQSSDGETSKFGVFCVFPSFFLVKLDCHREKLSCPAGGSQRADGGWNLAIAVHTHTHMFGACN